MAKAKKITKPAKAVKAVKAASKNKKLIAKKPQPVKAVKKIKAPKISSQKYNKKIAKKSNNLKPSKYLNFGNFSLAIGAILLVFGVSMLIGPFISRVNQKSLAVQSVDEVISQSAPPNQVLRVEGRPSVISVPSVGINLPIIDGIYYPKSASWSLSLDKAHYAVMTSLSNNQSGNTFIYAHNRRGVFINLPSVKVGDLAVITTEDGKKFTYRYRSATTTNPNDTQILNYQGAPILSLQTCTGLWYQNRTIFIFDYVSVEEAKPNA